MKIRCGRMGSRGILLEACESLEKKGFKTVELEYRPVSNRKSIDLIAFKNKRLIVVRGSENAISITRSEAEELKASANVINATPLILSRKIHSRNIEDDVMYIRHSIPTISPQGLERLLDGDFFIVSDRGGYYVAIDGEALREARMKNKLSLGDLARILGVSRKAVYMYERGEMKASIPVALKMIEIFGEEILKPISIGDIASSRDIEENVSMAEPDVKAEQHLIEKVREIGFQPFHFRTTPIDVVVKDERTDKTLLFTIEHSPKDYLESKLKASLKISQKTGLRIVVLASKIRLRKLEERIEGSWTQLSPEDLDKLSERDLA